jgi:hypothetical protein
MQNIPGLDPHSPGCGHFNGKTHLSGLLPAPFRNKADDSGKSI